MTEHVRMSDAARILGVTVQTLRAWDREGKLKTVRTEGNQRRIPKSEIHRLVGATDRTVLLAYARCSTEKQRDNLERQVGRLLEHANGLPYKVELYKDIGSGLNDNRKSFRKILKRIRDPDVAGVLVEYKDRVCRYGFPLFEEMCEGFGVKVFVMEDTLPKSFEQELTDDVIAILTSYSARMYGKRGGKDAKGTQNPAKTE